MNNPFSKAFDELFNDIKTDYKNQTIKDENGNLIPLDTSQGSLIFIKSACMASALWGAHKAIEWTGDEIFPDTADTENLEHHVWVRGLVRKINDGVAETDPELLARLLDYIRRPPAGGNKYDYVKWAMSIQGVKAAYCFPLAQGLGTVDVVIIGVDPEIPEDSFLLTVKTYIDDVRPVTASIVRVLGPTITAQDVTVSVTGADVNQQQIIDDITAYLNTFIPGQKLYLAQLVAIAVRNGADGVTITFPVADITPDTYEMLRPGVITVNV